VLKSIFSSFLDAIQIGKHETNSKEFRNSSEFFICGCFFGSTSQILKNVTYFRLKIFTHPQSKWTTLNSSYTVLDFSTCFGCNRKFVKIYFTSIFWCVCWSIFAHCNDHQKRKFLFFLFIESERWRITYCANFSSKKQSHQGRFQIISLGRIRGQCRTTTV